MASQKIKGTACSIYSVNHHLPAVYTVVIWYMGITAIYQRVVVSMDTSMRMHSTSHLDNGLIVAYLIYMLEVRI